MALLLFAGYYALFVWGYDAARARLRTSPRQPSGTPTKAKSTFGSVALVWAMREAALASPPTVPRSRSSFGPVASRCE